MTYEGLERLALRPKLRVQDEATHHCERRTNGVVAPAITYEGLERLALCSKLGVQDEATHRRERRTRCLVPFELSLHRTESISNACLSNRIDSNVASCSQRVENSAVRTRTPSWTQERVTM